MTASKKLSIAIFQWGWEILHAVADGYKKLGHEVRLFELNEKSEITPILRDLEKNPPDLCLTNNMYCFDAWGESGRQFEDFVRIQKLPFICWYWENPASSGSLVRLSQWQIEPYPNHLSFLVVDDTHLDFFRIRNLRVAYMPLGIDERMKSYQPKLDLAKKFQCDLSYSGTPDVMTPTRAPKSEAQLRAIYENFTLHQLIFGISEMVEFEPAHRDKNLSAIREGFVPHIHLLFSRPYFNGAAYEHAFNEILPKLQSVLPSQMHPILSVLKGRIDFCYSYYLLALGINELKEFHPHIFGGDNWKHWLMGSPEGQSTSIHSTPRLSEEELKTLFASSKISFCLTKIQFSNVVHERIFTVLACRGFPLSDYKRSIEELFPRNWIATYQNFEDARQKIKFYLDHSDQRLEMSLKAREWAFEHHTLQKRAWEILDVARTKLSIL